MSVLPRRVPRIGIVLASCLAITMTGYAFDQYSTSKTAGNCADCHGGFRSSGYISKVDNTAWGSNLHDKHRINMLSSDCNACHYSSRFPVYLGQAPGGNGLAGYSCSGCHGRAQDGTGVGTEGFGAGLRQRHWRGGVTLCSNCHNDSNPASKTVVGENILPPFFQNPGTGHPNLPTNPCNPAPAYPENFAATTLGLDNDGDGKFDMLDPDCSPAPAGPGETAGRTAAQLVVTAHNWLAGTMTLGYGTACQTADNVIYYGPLDQVATYSYSGQQCGVGSTGSYTWSYPQGPQSIFFLITGRNTSNEGSYGTRSTGTERPSSTTNATCPLPQSLTGRCD